MISSLMRYFSQGNSSISGASSPLGTASSYCIYPNPNILPNPPKIPDCIFRKELG